MATVYILCQGKQETGAAPVIASMMLFMSGKRDACSDLQ